MLYTDKRIGEMVAEDLKPSDVLMLDAFHNAIIVNRDRRIDQCANPPCRHRRRR